MPLLTLNRIVRSTNFVEFLRFACARRFCRNILGDKYVKLNKDTLTGRIFIYLHPDEPRKSFETKLHSTSLLEELKKSNINFRSRSVEDITDLITLLGNRSYISGRNEFMRVLRKLDDECCSRFHQLELQNVLQILNAFMCLIPNRIVELRFFQFFADNLQHYVTNLNKPDLLKVVFYAGQLKKDRRSQNYLHTVVLNMKELIDGLNLEELCTICHATYKTSTRIHSRDLLEKIRQSLNDNLSILKDPAFFLTLIKSIRQNEYQDGNLLSTISYAVFFNKTLQYYNFSCMCHILALYSDYLYYDENVFKFFTAKCMDELRESKIKPKSTYVTEQIRDKDLKRFFWCLSNVGYEHLTESDFNVIVPKIIERIECGELGKDPGTLVEIILYLWMLNYQAVEMLPSVLSDQSVKYIYGSQTRSKEKLNLLLTLIYFENRPLFNKFGVRPPREWNFNKKLQLTKRPVLRRVLENLKGVGQKFDITKFQVTAEVPFLNVIGITGYKKNIYKAVYIEVIDNYVSAKNKTDHISGNMQLKLRILNGLEEALVVINQNDIEELSKDELQKYLEEELALVC